MSNAATFAHPELLALAKAEHQNVQVISKNKQQVVLSAGGKFIVIEHPTLASFVKNGELKLSLAEGDQITLTLPEKKEKKTRTGSGCSTPHLNKVTGL